MALSFAEIDARALPPLPDGDPRVAVPSLADVEAATTVVRRHLPPTPLLEFPLLSESFGCRILLKCENLQPVGAFKVRGGLVLLDALSAEERARGVISASTGNHGQSIAYAARVFGARAVIYAPVGANPLKVAAMERLGAEVVLVGADFDEARHAAGARAERDGMYFVHSANEQKLIAGVGTATLEVMDAAPEADVLIVPAGGGSGLCGALIAGKGRKPALRVIGVQAAGAPAMADSWRRRELLAYDRVATFAEGLATRVAFELPAHIIWDRVDDFCLVTDAEMRAAMRTLLASAHLLAEGAGAASLAAAWQLRDRLKGQTVVCMLSGGNMALDALRDALDEERDR